jgi:hypothetical protein
MKTELKLNTHKVLQLIKNETEKITGIEDIGSKTRTRELVFARHIYIKAAREFTDYPTIMIGAAINRDHSTVVHALSSMEFDFKYDKDLQTKYDQLAIILTNKLNINAIENLDAQINRLQDQLNTLQKRKQTLINYESTNTEFENQKNVQVFWS